MLLQPSIFCSLRSLQLLDLRSNNLEVLPGHLHLLQQLQQLLLDGNKLLLLPPCIWRLPRLQLLSATSNFIDHICPPHLLQQ